MAAFCLLLTKVSLTSTGIRAQISNYIQVKQWVAITRPCRNFNGYLVEARTVNYIPHEITCVKSLIHARVLMCWA